MVILPKLALLVAAMLFVACARPLPLSRDEKVAASQITKVLPKGTSESRAMKALTDRGFSLSRMDSEPGANHLVVASQVRGHTFWQVGVVIVNAKVASTSVKVTDVTPASK